jgi:hypothetical protein
MKTKIFFFLLGVALLATSCATKKRTISHVESVPVYYTGNDEPAASGVFYYSDEQ